MATTQAHMELSWPPPFRSKYNSHAVQGKVDYSMTTPLKAGGADFPCKGYHVDMDDPSGGGAPVVTWSPGSAYNFTVVGGAPHNGGSCQAALSYDKGKKFTVIHSFMGDCPLMTTGDFKFTVPPDAKAGPAIFAWSWLNQVGNREYYMNCASVNIAGSPSEESVNISGSPSEESVNISGSPSEESVDAQVPFSERPDLFVANLGNGCTTVEGKDTIYPHPGPDVTSKYAKSDDSGSLQGNCDSGAKVERSISEISSIHESQGGTRIKNSGMNSNASTDGSVSEESDCSPIPEIKASVDGQCGGGQTCSGSMFGSCCSRFGFCGASRLHCGYGCMSEFGNCGSNRIPSYEPNGTDIIEPSGTIPDIPFGTSINMPNSVVPDMPHGTGMSQPNYSSPEMPYSTGIRQPSYAGPGMPYSTGIIQPSYASPDMPYGTGLSQPGYSSPEMPYGTGLSQPNLASPNMPYGTDIIQPSYASPDMPYGTGLSQPNYASPDIPYGTGLSYPSYTSPDMPYDTSLSQPSYASPEMPYGTGLSQPNKPAPKMPTGTGISMPSFGTGIGQPNKTGPKMPTGTGINMPNFGTGIGQPHKTGPKLPFGSGINMPNIPFMPWATSAGQPDKTGPKMPVDTGMNMPNSVASDMPDSTGTHQPNNDPSDTPTGTETSEPSSMCLDGLDSADDNCNESNKYSGKIPRYRSRSTYLRSL
ncbi:hypothetical protein K3495_g6402 [Podosphaera aphanis]|nr:hypothetical protein K3495_g6402 [Podosphaera aphanis]